MSNNVYIGIEDLAGNAFIEIIKRLSSEGKHVPSKIMLKFWVLEKYGESMTKHYHEKADKDSLNPVIVLDAIKTEYMFREFDDCFERAEPSVKGGGVVLKESCTLERLDERFRALYRPEELAWFYNKDAVDELYEIYTTGQNDEEA